MQPKLYFDRGFAATIARCVGTCPTGAILPSPKRRNHNQMGQVQLILKTASSITMVQLWSLLEHCPTQAVRIYHKGVLTIPEINPKYAWAAVVEYVCPAIAKPSTWGLTMQRRIEIEHDEVKEIQIDDFGF